MLRVSWRLARWINAGLLDHDDAQAAVYEAIELAGAEDMRPVHAQWERAIERADPLEVYDGSELGPLPDETPEEILAARGGRPLMFNRIRLPSQIGNEPAQPYIVKGLVRHGDVGAILGAPGAGKSMVTPMMLYKMALGLPVFGMRTKPVRVLYVTAEDHGGMASRVKALEGEHGTTGNFGLVDVANLREGQEAADLMAAVKAWRADVVAIDTLGAGFAGMTENNSEDMGEVVKLVRDIAATGASVVLVHHTAKNSDGSARGHSSLQGTLDWCVLLGDKTDDGIVRCKVTKNRAGPSDSLDLAFTQRSVTLGHDEDGDAITAPMAVELAARKLEDRKPVKELPKSLSIPLDILKNLLESTGQRTVSIKEWQDACLADGGMGLVKNAGWRTKFSRARLDLIVRKLITVDKNELTSVVSRPVLTMLRPSLADLADDSPQH